MTEKLYEKSIRFKATFAHVAEPIFVYNRMHRTLLPEVRRALKSPV